MNLDNDGPSIWSKAAAPYADVLQRRIEDVGDHTDKVIPMVVAW